MANLAPDYLTNPAGFAPQPAPSAPDPMAGMTPEEQLRKVDQESGLDQYSPDYWTGVTARARALPKKLLAGGMAGLNTMGYGLPDVILKAASSDTYKKLKDLQAANPGATALGTGAGLALGLATGSTEGQAAKPFLGPGGLVGLAGRGAELIAPGSKVAKGIGDVSRFMAEGGNAATGAGKVLQGAGQGALLGAEQNIIPVIGGTETPLEGLAGTALGAAGGAAVPAISTAFHRIPEELDKMREWGAKTMLKRADVNNRDLRTMAQNFMGGDPAKVDAFVQHAAEEVRDKELFRKPVKEAYIDDAKKQWQDWSDAWEAKNETFQPGDLTAGTPASSMAADARADLLNKVAADPDAQSAIERLNARKMTNPNVKVGGDDEVNRMMTQVDATEGLAGKREYLANVIYDDSGKFGGDQKAIARALRNGLDDQARQAAGITGEQWAQMKEDYPLKVLLQKGGVRAEASLTGTGLPAGSDTAAKLALGTIAAGGLGATQVQGVTNDPGNPEAWIRLLAAITGGALVGAGKNLIGNTLARVAMRLGPEQVAEFAQKVGAASSIAEVQKIAAQVEASQVGQFGKKVLASPTSVVARGASMVPQAEGGLPNTTAESRENITAMDEGRAPTPPPSAAAEGVAPEAQGQAVATSQTETQATPQQKVEATWTTNQKYQGAIEQALQQHWAGVSRYITYPEFKQQVADATDNFNPLYSAKILFSDAKAQGQYLKDYQSALQLKGVNAATVYDQNKHTNLFDPKQRVKQEGYNNLIFTIGAAIDGKAPSAGTTKMVKERLDSIMKQKISAEQKNEEMLDFMKTAGFGTDQLAAIGLI